MALTITHPFVSTIPDDAAAKAAGEVNASDWNANHTITGTVDSSIGARQILAANTNYYVRTDGNDSNTGTANSSVGAWATLTHAMSFIASNIDTGGFIVTVNIGVGSFAGMGVRTCVGGGTLQFFGAGSASTFIQDGPNDGLFNGGECLSVYVDSGGVKHQYNALTFRPLLDPFAVVDVFALINLQFFGATSDVKFDITHSVGGSGIVLWLDFPGSNISEKSFTFTANGASVNSVYTVESGTFLTTDNNGGNSTVIGNLTCTFAYIALDTNAYVANIGHPVVVSGGAVTGQRFNLITNSGLGSTGGPGVMGPNFFPGTIAGTADPSSMYDGFPGPLSGIDTQTGASYTLAIGDAFEIVEMNNAGANTVTIPSSSSVNFEIGTKIQITQIGAGATATSSSTASGVILHNFGAVGGQWKSVQLYKRGPDEWVQTVA